MPDRVGQRLGNYHLLRLLGRGGFAEVYLGEHLHLGTQAAIKVLHTQLAHDDVEQFRTEARTIAHLVHPHIVRVLEFGVEGSTPFLVMDYAPNGTLRQRHPKGVPLPLPTIVNYINQIAPALQYAHNEKLIHRDIKPENMLLGRHNEILLSDFGIALVAHSSRSQNTEDIAGTITYMAPEQIQAHPRPASDQYSLGIVVYEWLSGRRPFDGSFAEIAIKHTIVPPPSLREKVPTLSPDVEQVVMIALTKDPKLRFASVQAFATALEEASKSSPALAVLPSQSTATTEAADWLNQSSRSSALVTPPGQPPAPQLTSPGQPSQPIYRDTSPNLSARSMDVAPSLSSGAITPPPLSLAQEYSRGGVQPQRQGISQRMLLLSLAVLLVVVLAGGGITWLALFLSSGLNTGGTPGSGSHHGSTAVPTNPHGGIVGSTLIKIATDLPVSGADASVGKPVENAAHLAVDQANAHHTIPGYTLEFVPKDDVGPSGTHDPAVGAQDVTSLIGDALVAGIVGPFNSNVARAEMPIANQAPIALISPSNSTPCLTQQGAAAGCAGANDLLPTLRPTGKVTYFRIVSPDNYQGVAGADYLFKSLNYKKVYVIDDTSVYGVGLSDTFIAEWQKLGGTVLGHSSEPSTTTSYVGLLTQIATTHPDVLYFGGLDSTGGILIRQQMQQVPALATTPFAGGDGIATPVFASTIGTAGGPVYSTAAVVDTSKNPSAATFVSQYEAVYGNTPNVYSAGAYDCANILIQAIKTALANGAHTPQDSSDAAGARTIRQAVINAIQNISYNGVTGHQAFDANGDTTDRVVSVYKLAANTSGQPDWIFQKTVTVS